MTIVLGIIGVLGAITFIILFPLLLLNMVITFFELIAAFMGANPVFFVIGAIFIASLIIAIVGGYWPGMDDLINTLY